MELQELYGLMERFAGSGLSELEWRKEAEQIILRRTGAPASQSAPIPGPTTAAAAAPALAVEGDLVKAPLVGTFYIAPAHGEPAFAAPGKRVKKGETLCLIEAMKMMSEVPAPADCVVEELLAKDGEPVGYGEALFRIRRG
ncbi:MAG: biotin/lipoyl-containing protein [Lawsonibacter sp.]|nr:biotin/lipoyl-containing protein [Lawsonibacter sp.]